MHSNGVSFISIRCNPRTQNFVQKSNTSKPINVASFNNRAWLIAQDERCQTIILNIYNNTSRLTRKSSNQYKTNLMLYGLQLLCTDPQNTYISLFFNILYIQELLGCTMYFDFKHTGQRPTRPVTLLVRSTPLPCTPLKKKLHPGGVQVHQFCTILRLQTTRGSGAL